MEREQQYVGIGLHRRRSVIVRINDAGEVLGVTKIENDPLQFAAAIAEAGPDPEVVLEACYGWYWAADLLQANGARVHLVHPLGLHWDSRRVKNDVKDATELAHRLRRNDVPEAWIAPAPVREVRELVRYRAKLTALRTSAKAQVHAVMAKLGILPPLGDMFGPGGQKLLDEMDFPGVYGLRVESLRDLLEIYERELIMVEGEIHRWLHDDVGYRAIQALHGVGPITAAILVADRRYRPVPIRPTPVLVGRHDPHVARVRHQVQPRSHLQAGIDHRSVGGGRGRRPLSRRRCDRPRLSPYRRAAREQDRPRGGGQKAAHTRLLRAARRRDPPPVSRGRVSMLGRSQDASSRIAVAPTVVAWPSN